MPESRARRGLGHGHVCTFFASEPESDCIHDTRRHRAMTSWHGVETNQRCTALKLLLQTHPDFAVVRTLEATVHSLSTSHLDYGDRILRVAHNIQQTPSLVKLHGSNLPLVSDKELARGTILEDIETETILQQSRFNRMLQEKYDTVNQEKYKATLKCRRCGSPDVTWQQKQTRGADESMTWYARAAPPPSAVCSDALSVVGSFCTCNKCNNRWTMR